MKKLHLTSFKPLTPLLDLVINGQNIDLHNEYECVHISTEADSLIFNFIRFVEEEKKKTVISINELKIVFVDFFSYKLKEILAVELPERIDGLSQATLDKEDPLNKKSKMFLIKFIGEWEYDIYCEDAYIEYD